MSKRVKLSLKLSSILLVGTFFIVGSADLEETSLGQALLGPLSAAEFKIYDQRTNEVIHTGMTSKGDGSDISTAGLINVPQTVLDSFKSKLYRIEVTGGTDIDADDDGVWDVAPTQNIGTLHSLMNGDKIKEGDFKINILNEIVYQNVKDQIDGSQSDEQIEQMLDDNAKELLKDSGDVNGDGKIDNQDLVDWNPAKDKDKLEKDYDSEIKPIADAVHNGEEPKRYDTKNITGTIIGNSSSKSSRSLHTRSVDGADKIVVIDSLTYEPPNYKVEMSFQEFDIHSDGTFDIDTSKFTNNKLVMLVVNSATKKIYGNLNLGTSGNDKLDFIDKSKLIDNLEMGSIDIESNCSTAATVQSVGSFSDDDVTILEKLAKLDDGLVTYGNYYKNLDSNNSVWIDSVIEYAFHVGTLADATSQYSDVTNFDTSKLYNKYISIGSSDPSWENLDDSDAKLYPPSAVKYQEFGTKTYNGDANQTVSLSNEEEGCGDNGPGWFGCGFAALETVPSGEWIFKIKDVEKARFEFNDVDPFEANDKLKVPIPSIKINMNGNYISSVDLQWYIYNGSTYEKASEEIMNAVAVAPDLIHPEIAIDIKDDEDDGIGIATNKWSTNYPFPSDKQDIEIGNESGQVNQIGMEYNIGQIKYYFWFDLNDWSNN